MKYSIKGYDEAAREVVKEVIKTQKHEKRLTFALVVMGMVSVGLILSNTLI